MIRSIRPLPLVALAAALALAGCGRGDDNSNNIAAIDNQLTGNESELSNALAAEIGVSPDLANKSGGKGGEAVAPAAPAQPQPQPKPQPQSQPQPQPQPAPAPAQAASADAPAGCTVNGGLDRGAGWADRLPESFPIYPGARRIEAAGRDSGACRVRVVTFASYDDWRHVVAWYRGRAAGAGYSTGEQVRGGDHILGGARGESAYYLIATPNGGATTGSLIVNTGR